MSAYSDFVAAIKSWAGLNSINSNTGSEALASVIRDYSVAATPAPIVAVNSLKKTGEAVGLTGAVELEQGTAIALTQTGQKIKVDAVIPASVNSIKKTGGDPALIGVVELTQGARITLTQAGQAITIEADAPPAVVHPRLIPMLSSPVSIPSDGATYEYGQTYVDPVGPPVLIGAGQNIRFCAEGRIGALASQNSTILLWNLTDAEAVTGGTLTFNDADTATHHKATAALTVGALAGNFKDTAKIYTARLHAEGANGAAEVLVPSNVYLEVY